MSCKRHDRTLNECEQAARTARPERWAFGLSSHFVLLGANAARRAAQFDLSGRIRTLRNPSVPLLIALRAGNRLKYLSLRFLNGTDRREVSAPAFTESGRPNLLDFDILTGS